MDTMTLRSMVDATPASRDRYVDLLRAISIGVVVFGHWLMAIVTFEGGRFGGSSALDTLPGVWILTWVLQVMPLFFFVGGFSNMVSWDSVRRRGGTYAEYLSARLSRLLRPTFAFVATWVAAAIGLELAGVTQHAGIGDGVAILARPLWFLSVYVGVVAVAPALLALHRRAPGATLATMVLGAGAVDAVRLGAGWEWFGYANFAFVWLFAHQLGFAYADGSLARAGRRAHAAMAIGGLAMVALLTNIGVYAPSLVGTTSRLASNNGPPSVVLVMHSIWLVGLAMLARGAATRWLQGRRAWSAVVAANAMIMTVFLWHMTAMVLGALVAFPLGFPQPEPGSAAWWALRPAWIATLVALLVPLVVAFGRFERGSAPAVSAAASPRRTALGVAAFVGALAGFATQGFVGMLEPAPTVFALTPMRSALLLAAGAVLLSPRRARAG